MLGHAVPNDCVDSLRMNPHHKRTPKRLHVSWALVLAGVGNNFQPDASHSSEANEYSVLYTIATLNLTTKAQAISHSSDKWRPQPKNLEAQGSGHFLHEMFVFVYVWWPHARD